MGFDYFYGRGTEQYAFYQVLHIAKLIGRVCEAKRPHSVSERPARALS